MIAVGFLAAILAIGLAFGTVLYRWRAGKLLWLKVTGSILVGLGLVLATAIGAVALTSSVPFPEDVKSNDEYVVRVFAGPAPDEEGVVPGGPPRSVYQPGTPVCQFTVSAPPKTAVGDDFRMQLAIQTPPAAQTRASLLGSSDWELRSPDQCSASDKATLCLAAGAAKASGEWIIRPKTAALSDWTISANLDIAKVCASPWHADFQVNGRVLARNDYGIQSKLSSLSPRRDAQNDLTAGAIIFADSNHPSKGIGIDVDLARMRFDGHLEVTRTVGVSEGTFQWMAIFGAVVSSALGSGWLISLGAAILRRFSSGRPAAAA